MDALHSLRKDIFSPPKDLKDSEREKPASPREVKEIDKKENYKNVLVVTIITGILFIVGGIALFYLTTIILPIILLTFGLITPIIGIILFATHKSS